MAAAAVHTYIHAPHTLARSCRTNLGLPEQATLPWLVLIGIRRQLLVNLLSAEGYIGLLCCIRVLTIHEHQSGTAP